MIGIIVAMEKELRLLLPLIEDLNEVSTDDGFTFHIGRLGKRDVTVMKCGIGKVNAALGTNSMINNFAPALIISTGVAGGAGGDARIADIVVGDRVAYHDVWCGPGTTRGEAAGCPRYFLSSPDAVALDCLQAEDVHHGLICSGDIFVDSPEVVSRIRSIYPDVMAVDMESAAIAQTCYLRDVPVLCIRVLSDTPGDNDNNISQYENFWEEAPQRTFAILRSVLAEL